MNKKEKLELKLRIIHESLNSDNPAEVLEEYEKKYPEILDKTLMELKKEKENKITTNKGELITSANNVDFLDDLNKTIEYLKSKITLQDKLVKLKFYTPGKIDDNNSFERCFYSFEDMNMAQESYNRSQKITMILKNNDIVRTIHCDKKSGRVAIIESGIADNNRKSEVNKMSDEVNFDIINMDDNCTYYKFQFGIIGKYDPDKSNYYIYEDNKWKLSGDVMRWVEDAGYECEIIKKMAK